MKKIDPIPGYNHISVVRFAPHALGADCLSNQQKFIEWFTAIVESTSEIIGYECIASDGSVASEGNVYFRAIYRHSSGLALVRKLPEHEKMMAWFEQVKAPDRLDVNFKVA